MTGFKKGDRVRVLERHRPSGNRWSKSTGTVTDVRTWLSSLFITVCFCEDLLNPDLGSYFFAEPEWLELVGDSVPNDPMSGARSRTDENLRRVFG